MKEPYKNLNVGQKQRVVIQLLYAVTKSIDHLHKYKIMHRDLKLDNILIDAQRIIKLGTF